MAKVNIEKTATTKTARGSSKIVVKTAGSSAKSSKGTTVKTIAVGSGNADKNTKTPQRKATSSAEKGLVLRQRAIDPELALMASRTAAAERPRPRADITKVHRNGRSMSGMVVMPTSSARRAPTVAQDATEAEVGDGKVGDDSRFSKFKSALVGVGVALVVAVVGFAGIAIFGNNKKMCTVQFESNGGSKVSGTEIVCGRTVKQPEDPTKEGFSFEGWILEGDPFDFGTGIYKNATLVAKWKTNEGTETVTVKFDTDGGSKMEDVEIAKGRTISRPSIAPTKMGYVFEDWYLGDEVYDFSKPVNENITLRAKWTRRTSGESNNNSGSSNNTAKPSSNRVTSLEVGDMVVELGKTFQTTIMILPSAAEFKLTISVADTSVASCSVNGSSLSCKGEKAGSTVVTVRDELSGNKDSFTVTVNDTTSVDPEPTEPDPEEPKDPDQPDPEPPVEPEKPEEKPTTPDGSEGSGDENEVD